MNRSKPQSGQRRGANLPILIAAVFIIAAYPLLGMLWHHEYPVWTAEVSMILLAAAALAGVLGWAIFLAGTLASNVVLAALITFALLLQFNLLFIGIVAVAGVTFVLAAVFRDRFPLLALCVVAAMLLGSWLDNRLNPATRMAHPAPATSATPGPVIHILMDGFTGPDGLPGPELSGNLRENVIAFFETNDFELHTRAYSHYNATLDSMTRLLNFRNDDANLFQRATVLREPLAFPENRWFQRLQSAGYALNVYQSESVDFCAARLPEAIHCNVFPMPNLKTIHRDLAPATARIPVLLQTLAGQSEILTSILRNRRILGTWGVSVYDKRMLPKLADDVSLRPADAYFAHVLVPHSPLVFRDDCSVDYTTHPGLRWAAEAGLQGNSEQSRKSRYPRIVAQTQCAMRLLGELFATLKDNGLYGRATIIVHGDHGSSAYIYSPSVYNLERSFQRDYLESFSTLFAVKWPNGVFRRVDDVESINVLMSRVADRVTGRKANDALDTIREEPEPFIFLTDEEPLRKVVVDIFSNPGKSRSSPDK